MYCRNCGKEIDDKAVVCIHCGVATSDAQSPFQSAPAQQPVINIVNTNTNTNTNTNGVGYIHKKRSVALLLAIFLGWAGAHRFYVGKSGTGILYLCTGGLCFVGWVIDILAILAGGFRDKAGQPLV